MNANSPFKFDLVLEKAIRSKLAKTKELTIETSTLVVLPT
jgi:hypothetical protein